MERFIDDGIYTLTVEPNGFKKLYGKEVQPNVVININVDLPLSIGPTVTPRI